jgi:hypothetical protein
MRKTSIIVFICAFILLRFASIAIAEAPSEFVIQNKNVKALIERTPNNLLSEKYYARLQNGEWKLIVSQFIPKYHALDTAETQLWNTSLNPYRFLVQKMQVTEISKLSQGGVQRIIVHFTQNGNKFIQTISLGHNEEFFHIEVLGELKDPEPRLDYLLSSYNFNYKGVPDFVHTPGVKFDDPRSGKGRDQILGDRAFHSPAVVLQQKNTFAALIPDLRLANLLATHSDDARKEVLFTPSPVFYIPVPDDLITMPVGIDLNVNTNLSLLPILSYGLVDAKVGMHTRFVRDEHGSVMVRKLREKKIGYGFDLLVRNMPAGEPGYPLASQHLWKYFGAPVFNSKPHLVMPYENYLKQVTSTIFFPIRDSNNNLYEIPGGVIDPPIKGYEDHGSWVEWKSGGLNIGGFRCAAPFWTDVINNSVFWNQAANATGMFYWGTNMNDTMLISNARKIINFCLSAPKNKEGLFSTVYSAKDSTWGIGWTDPPRGKDVLFLRDAKTYEIPALCKTGAHMLDYYLRAEKDERIIKYLVPFANWLLANIDKNGIIPSYVTDDMKTSDIMYESAQPASGMWFLAEMYNATKRSEYLEGAKKIAAYIERDIIPTGKWLDMEQYISCGKKPFSMIKDDWQGQWFRGNLCVMWASEGFAALNRATNDPSWLKYGAQCIDYLSFTQEGWSPNFIYSANPFGGFGADNSDDAAMMDQRQAEFVRPYIFYGIKLNRSDLLQRGIAAAQAACVLIHNKRHVENGITPAPRFYPEGLAPENIDHEGVSQWPMRTHPLWGEGIAVFTGLSEVRRAVGGLYIDLDNDIVIGADGVKIVNDNLHSDSTRIINVESFMSKKYLAVPYDAPYCIDAVIVSGKGQKLKLNGEFAEAGRMKVVIGK